MEKKILIVDDVFDNIKVVMNYLQEYPYELYFANDGKQALQRLEAIEPDLILMDVMMPELNGYETVKIIKENKKYQNIPIIFLTALGEPEDISKGFEAGGVDHITKPIHKLELLARVKIHLELEDHRKNLEKKVIEEKEEIDYLKKAQKQLVESEKMASLGGLVAGVAHEINTPLGIGLTGITHFLDMTKNLNKLYKKENMSKDEFENYLNTSYDLAQTIYNNMEKAAQLIRNFKQIAIDQSLDRKREFNLKQYIEDIVLSLHNIIKKTKHKIKINCDEDITLYTNPGDLLQLFSNLIINSLIHAYNVNDEGLIQISIKSEKNKIIIIFEDDGKGIPNDIKNNIFEPFFTTNRSHGGSGLGLNIVYNIVKTTFKGEINCTSTEGEGAKFIITTDLEELNQETIK